MPVWTTDFEHHQFIAKQVGEAVIPDRARCKVSLKNGEVIEGSMLSGSAGNNAAEIHGRGGLPFQVYGYCHLFTDEGRTLRIDFTEIESVIKL